MRPCRTVNIDIGKPINQQDATQLFPAAAQHFHRHRPFAGITVGVLPLQQPPVIAAIGIAGNGRDTDRAGNLDIADLRVPVRLINQLVIPQVFFGKAEPLRQPCLPPAMQGHFVPERLAGAFQTIFLTEIIPVSFMAGRRQGHPAVNRFCRLLCPQTPGVFFPVQQIVISGQHNAGIRPFLPYFFSRFKEIRRRHGGNNPAGSDQGNRERGGETLCDDDLLRCRHGNVSEHDKTAAQLAAR